MPTSRTPQLVVLAVDQSVGALLLEAIKPGTSLAESPDSPGSDSLAMLLTSLHLDVEPDPPFPALGEQ